MLFEEPACVEKNLEITCLLGESFGFSTAKKLEGGYEITVCVPQLPVLVWFSVELAFDVCPIGIINLEVLAPAPRTITKDAIYLKTNGTFSALKLRIDFTLKILRSDGTPVRRTTALYVTCLEPRNAFFIIF